MIIGLCGKSCSGKSSISNLLKEKYNAMHLDIDKVGHRVLGIDEVKIELINCYGTNILDNGIISRKRLGELVFNSRRKMNKLTDITWKYMQIEIDNFIELNKDKIIILDWLLLPKSKYFEMCDIKILLDIPYEVRVKRAIKRDNISEKDFELREKASIDFDKDKFDYVFFDNNIVIERLVLK